MVSGKFAGELTTENSRLVLHEDAAYDVKF